MSQAGSNSTLYAPRIPLIVPKVDDPATQQLLRIITMALNNLPPTSQFSYTSPNSNVSALPGTWGHNIASSASVTWFKQTGSGNTGWTAIA